jgi:hypothetical protein
MSESAARDLRTHLLFGALACAFVVLAFSWTSRATRAQMARPQRSAGRPPPQAATLSGRVSTTGDRSVWGVLVTAHDPSSGAVLTALTDNAGHFTFDDVAPGYYTLLFMKPGYAGAAYGAKHAGDPGAPVAIAAGRHTDLMMTMTKGGVIAGRILDEIGAPVAGARIFAVTRHVEDGAPRDVAAGAGSTDDDGRYRVFGLQPGKYLIAVASPYTPRQPAGRAGLPFPPSALALATAGAMNRSDPPARATGYLSVFYPGVFDPSQAGIVTLNAAETRTNADVTFHPRATIEMRGYVVLPDGRPAARAEIVVRAAPDNASAAAGGTNNVTFLTRPDGRFVVPDLQVGAYTVIALATSPGSGRMTMAAPPSRGIRPGAFDLVAIAHVTTNDTGFVGVPTLHLARGGTVQGTITTSTSAASGALDLQDLQIAIRSDAATGLVAVPPAGVGADGSFTIRGVPPGVYTLSVSNIAVRRRVPVSVQAAIADGVDALNEGLTIAPGADVTDIQVVVGPPTSLTGSVLDVNGLPSSAYYVAVFPQDERAWTPRSARLRMPMHAATDGAFQFDGLPAGDYYVAALADFDAERWPAASDLRQLVRTALKVSLRSGESTQVNLQVAAQ